MSTNEESKKKVVDFLLAGLQAEVEIGVGA